jgi:opacity protein-like surface antigen
MRANRFLPLLLLLGLFVSAPAAAQLEMRGLEIGPWAGVSFYLGDLNTDFRFDRPNLAGGFAARYNFNHRLAAKVSFNYGKIEAYDSDSGNPFEQNRNLSFQSDIFDGTAQFEFNFLPYFHGHKEYFFTPYAFAGISVFNYNPKAETDGGELVELRGLGTEGQLRGEEYLVLSSALAYGIGLKWDLTYELSMDLHVGVRNASTDYLDDVSTVYPDASDLLRSRGPLAAELYDRSLMLDGEGNRIDREGEQRGDDTMNDRYIFVGLGLNYYFGDVRCPDYGNKRSRRRRR